MNKGTIFYDILLDFVWQVVDSNRMKQPNTNYDHEKIGRLMDAKGWSWNELGRRAGFGGNSTIHTVRRNGEMIDGEVVWMTPRTAKAVAKALRVSLSSVTIKVDD